jgi:zinc transporter ZupT
MSPAVRATLDRLREWFPYIVAVVLPLAGLILALGKFAENDRDEALRIGLATLAGCFIYSALFFA